MKQLALLAIRCYQRSVSRALPPACRYEPSCSHYAHEAIDRYGLVRGGWLTMRRLARCHPLHATAFDPVP